MQSKWSKKFFADYAERVGSVAGYELVAFLVASATGVDFGNVWPVYGVPIALSAVKGLLANLSNPESGASLLPAPPGPEVAPKG